MYQETPQNSRFFQKAFTPAAPASTLYNLFQTYRKVKDLPVSERAFETILKKQILLQTGSKELFLFSSGKVSLLQILRILKKKTKRDYILVSAYTCPDIAAAAVSAGFKIALVDFKHNTLSLDPLNIPVDLQQVAAVIFSNLYGYSELLIEWKELARNNDFYLIDDACQSFLSKENNLNLGGRGHFGIYSFGRGKAISGVGGGGLSLNTELSAKDLSFFSAELDHCYGQLNPASSGLKNLFYGILMQIFSQPYFYKIPLSLPFLNIGETHYPGNINEKFISALEELYALANLNSAVSAFSENTKLWIQNLQSNKSEISIFYPQASDCLIRFAILLPQGKNKQEVVKKLINYGVSASYPCTLDRFSELQGRLVFKEIKVAANYAERLCTLPLHQNIHEDIIKEVSKYF